MRSDDGAAAEAAKEELERQTEDLERRLKNGQEMAAKELEAAVNEAAQAVMKLRDVENDARIAAEEGGARIRAHETELESLRREAAAHYGVNVSEIKFEKSTGKITHNGKHIATQRRLDYKVIAEADAFA